MDQRLGVGLDTLQAITRELLMVGCAAGTLGKVWSAIEDRSRQLGHAMALGVEGDLSRMARAVGSVRREPSRLMLPVGVQQVRNLVRLAGLPLTQRRDVLMTVLGTVACLRVSEVSSLHMCDSTFPHDAAWSPE